MKIARLWDLTGHEMFEIEGVDTLAPRKQVKVDAKSADGKKVSFSATVRVDTPEEVSYYQHGGILQYVMRQMLRVISVRPMKRLYAQVGIVLLLFLVIS